jgi:hypothetical protein
VPSHLLFYADAFWRLNGDRQIGMGLGPIPFSAIDRYATRYGITEVDEFDYFLRLIKVQDSEYMLLQNRKPSDGNTVAANDVQGVKDLLTRIKAKREAALKHDSSQDDE